MFFTTHVGSLPRSLDSGPIARKAKGIQFEPDDLQTAVRDIVRNRLDLGIDIVTDGEMSKPNFLTYIDERLGGLEREIRAGIQNVPNPWTEPPKEYREFPGLLQRGRRCSSHAVADDLHRAAHIQGLRDPAAGHRKTEERDESRECRRGFHAFDLAFKRRGLPGGQIYRSEEEHLFALADAMHEEHKAIVDFGLLLQVDDPDLVTHYMMGHDVTVEQPANGRSRELKR